LFDLATWQITTDDEYSRYALIHTSEFFPVSLIRRSGVIRTLPEAPRSDVGAVEAKTDAFGQLKLDDFLARSQTDGFIVLHHGRIVYERYPHMRPTDHHLLWSVSKPFAGLLVAQLAAEGKVDIHAPIERFIPALANTAWQGTPVIDILDMASGMNALENDEENTWDRPELTVFQYESSLGLLRRTPATDHSTYEIVAAIPRLRPSGERFEYVSVNTFVLGWLVESVTHQPYADAISERIWSKVGAESDAAIVTAPRTGATAPHGGITTSLRDLARYGLLYTPSGGAGKDAVVPPGYIKAIQQGGRPALVAQAAPGSKVAVTGWAEPAHHFTYQWDAVWPDGDFYKGGYRGQGLYISPSRDLVVAFFGATGQGQKAYTRALAKSGLFK
jgi:CubicO group peptidase (beta-lactamase class C family)